jgi:hypothetical protein
MADEHAFYDARGRFLSVADGASLSCKDGIASERSSFVLEMSRPEGVELCTLYGGFVSGAGPFQEVEDVSDAATFSLETNAEDRTVRLRLCRASPVGETHGAEGASSSRRYLSVSDAGEVSAGPSGTSFTMAPAPVNGSINARWALDTMDGKRISLWGGPLSVGSR